VGMSSLMSLIFLHFISFNIDKNIICMDISDKYNQNLIKKIKYTYLSLPFFLKQGILTWSNKNIQFENGCSITTWVNRKNISVGYCPDILYMCNFARMKHKDDLYKNSIPTMSTRKENRLIIHSGQNGYDTFYKLVVNSEKLDGDPDKNMYKTQRIYWWQVPGRDINWKSNMIKTIGEDMWNEEYDMVFFDKNKK